MVIIAVVASIGGLLVIIAMVGLFVWLRRRRRASHTKVPTDDPEKVTAQKHAHHNRDLGGSIDSTSRRPLLYDDSSRDSRRSSVSAPSRSLARPNLPRQSSNLRYTQLPNDYPSHSIQMNIPSKPLYDTYGKDKMIHLPDGAHILSHSTSLHGERDDSASVDSHAAPSTIELPNPFEESLASGSSSASFSRTNTSFTATEASKISTTSTTAAVTSHENVLRTNSPSEISKPASLAASDDKAGSSADHLSEIPSAPQPAQMKPTALSTAETPRITVTIRPLPSPGTASRQGSLIRPLPHTPISKPSLVRNTTARSQSADLLMTTPSPTPSRSAGINRTLSPSNDTASVYSQVSATSTREMVLNNPYEVLGTSTSGTPQASAHQRKDSEGLVLLEAKAAVLINPHDRNVASVAKRALSRSSLPAARPRPRRGRSANNSNDTNSSPGSGSRYMSSTLTSSAFGSLSTLAEDAEPGSAAVNMRFALAQAVEAARRDSLYHDELYKEREREKTRVQEIVIPLTDEPESLESPGSSLVSGEVDKFEADVKSWLTSPRVLAPVSL